MTVLSLFDGMSCGHIALKCLGIKVDKYYASEIDKQAIKQTLLNFPKTIQLGSVTEVDVNSLDRIDLLIGGSPCTNFSFAGKRNGMSTATNEKIYTLDRYLQLKEDGFQFEGESFLFWEYIRILNDIRKYNPNVKFLLENVEMGKKWERILSEAIGIFGVHINSALVSAQNRKRIYWTNIRTKKVGLFGEVHTDIPQPEDKGILLRDILEDNVEEKYYLTTKALEYLKRAKEERTENVKYCTESDKTSTITCNYRRGVHNGGEPHVKISPKGHIKKDQYKSSCLTGASGHGAGNHSDMDLILVGGIINGEFINGMTKDFSQGARIYSPNGKSVCLSSSGGGLGAKTGLYITQRPRGFNKGADFHDKCQTISSNSWEQNNLLSGERIRRLTPTECSRLQTIPDWYKWDCSDSQVYKMCGNGWTVDVIAHILSFFSNIPDIGNTEGR